MRRRDDPKEVIGSETIVSNLEVVWGSTGFGIVLVTWFLFPKDPSTNDGDILDGYTTKHEIIDGLSRVTHRRRRRSEVDASDFPLQNEVKAGKWVSHYMSPNARGKLYTRPAGIEARAVHVGRTGILEAVDGTSRSGFSKILHPWRYGHSGLSWRVSFVVYRLIDPPEMNIAVETKTWKTFVPNKC